MFPPASVQRAIKLRRIAKDCTKSYNLYKSSIEAKKESVFLEFLRSHTQRTHHAPLRQDITNILNIIHTRLAWLSGDLYAALSLPPEEEEEEKT